MKINKRSTEPASGEKTPFPLSLTLTAFICVGGIAVAYLRRTGNFSIAFGDALMIGAFAMF